MYVFHTQGKYSGELEVISRSRLPSLSDGVLAASAGWWRSTSSVNDTASRVRFNKFKLGVIDAWMLSRITRRKPHKSLLGLVLFPGSISALTQGAQGWRLAY